MVYPLGLFIALTSIFAAVVHLKQSASNYFDFVALVIVLGGTLSVAVITFPWQYRREIVEALRHFIVPVTFVRKVFLAECINFVRKRGGEGTPQTQGLPGSILKDGAELIGLGFSTEVIAEILNSRIEETVERRKKVANAFRGLAKYPPAFGLVGTVLGLVNLMRAVSSGADARSTGVQMAVALVATLYGLLTANLIVSPAGELILKHALDEQKLAQTALEAVLLAMRGANPLEAQEVLNSYFSASDRISVTATLTDIPGVA